MELQLDDAVISYEYQKVSDDHMLLLFLHGALGTRRQFDALQERFAERSRIVMDFPSHGESTLLMLMQSTPSGLPTMSSGCWTNWGSRRSMS